MRQGYLARGVTEILTFTPCDMWPLVAGRTLFFTGDSQTQARAHGRLEPRSLCFSVTRPTFIGSHGWFWCPTKKEVPGAHAMGC